MSDRLSAFPDQLSLPDAEPADSFQEDSGQRQRADEKGKTEDKRLADALVSLLTLADLTQAGVYHVEFGVDVVEFAVNGVKFGVESIVQFARLFLNHLADELFCRQPVQLAARLADFPIDLISFGHVNIPAAMTFSDITSLQDYSSI